MARLETEVLNQLMIPRAAIHVGIGTYDSGEALRLHYEQLLMPRPK